MWKITLVSSAPLVKRIHGREQVFAFKVLLVLKLMLTVPRPNILIFLHTRAFVVRFETHLSWTETEAQCHGGEVQISRICVVYSYTMYTFSFIHGTGASYGCPPATCDLQLHECRNDSTKDARQSFLHCYFPYVRVGVLS